MHVFHINHCRIHTVYREFLIVSTGIPECRIGKRYRIRMVSNLPVYISFFLDNRIKIIHDITGIVIIVVMITVPCLVKRHVDFCRSIYRLNGIVEHTECLCIFLGVSVYIRIFHIVPLLAGINLISNNPVRYGSVTASAVSLCQESCNCRHGINSFLLGSVKHYIRRR